MTKIQYSFEQIKKGGFFYFGGTVWKKCSSRTARQLPNQRFVFYFRRMQAVIVFKSDL